MPFLTTSSGTRAASLQVTIGKMMTVYSPLMYNTHRASSHPALKIAVAEPEVGPCAKTPNRSGPSNRGNFRPPSEQSYWRILARFGVMFLSLQYVIQRLSFMRETPWTGLDAKCRIMKEKLSSPVRGLHLTSCVRPDCAPQRKLEAKCLISAHIKCLPCSRGTRIVHNDSYR